MESHLEEDSVPFVDAGPTIKATLPVKVRGFDIKATLPVIVRGPDDCDTVLFVTQDPDIIDTVPSVVRGPENGSSLGISENNPLSDGHWKENTSLCSSGVSSMNSSLTSSGDLTTEDTIHIQRNLEHRDYEEHSDDDDSRLYGSGRESELSSLHVHYPPSLSTNLTIAKPLDAPVKLADKENPEFKKRSSRYQTINNDILRAQFTDKADISSSFSKLSIKDPNAGTLDVQESIGASVEQDITKYRSQENPDLTKSDYEHEPYQGVLDKLKSFIDQNKISERGKKTRDKSYHEASSQDNIHPQRRLPYSRFPSSTSSIEVFPETFGRNQYSNVEEVMQQYQQPINTNVYINTNNDAEGLEFASDDVMDEFLRTFSPEREPMADTHGQVIQGPPLPSFDLTFFPQRNMYSYDQSDRQQTTQLQCHYQANNNITQDINTSNFVFQNQHNELRYHQGQVANPVSNLQPYNLPVNTISEGFNVTEEMTNHCNNSFCKPPDTLTNVQNVPNEIKNNHNNTNSNQSYCNQQSVMSSPTYPPNTVSNHRQDDMMHYNYQGSGVSTRKKNEMHNSPATSNIPSSPSSSEKSLPSPMSQTSMRSPAMIQVQSPCPSTPDSNIPTVIADYRNPSVYSSNSSLCSGQSSSRSCGDQDGIVTVKGHPHSVSSTDIPHPTHFGRIADDDIDNAIDNDVFKAAEKSHISKPESDEDDDEDDDDEDVDEKNTPVHKLAYLPDDEFEAECRKFMESDKGSELRRSMNVTNRDERTPLYIAVIRNNIVAVKCFLDQGADPTKDCNRRVCFGRDNYITYNENVLHLACEKGFEEIVDLLVDHPSKQDLVNSRRKGDDKTPLLICLNAHDLYRNRLSIIRKLLRNGACLSLKETHSGKSPLMLAIEKHEIDFVREELARLNPDYRRELLEQTDYDGNTCLHFSAQIASRDNNGKSRVNHMTHSNLQPLTDEQVQRFNSSLNLDGANIDAQNLDKVRPKDLRRELIALPASLRKR